MSDDSRTRPIDPAEAARARDEIEDQTNVLLLAALAWVALHGDEEPDNDSAVARAATTLALKTLRATRRQFTTAPKLPTGAARTEWVRRQSQEITRRAMEDTRSHYSTVHKREVDKAKRAAEEARAARKAADAARRAERAGESGVPDPDHPPVSLTDDPPIPTRPTDDEIMATFASDRPWVEAAARTTATRLAAETALDMLPEIEKDTGVGHSKLWISRGDPKVRSLHRKLHGKVQALGDSFHEWPGGQSLSYPGDPKAPLDATINCRCALFLVPTADKELAEKTFAVDDSDFDVPEGVAASARPSWLRERAHREWMYELSMRRS